MVTSIEQIPSTLGTLGLAKIFSELSPHDQKILEEGVVYYYNQLAEGASKEGMEAVALGVYVFIDEMISTQVPKQMVTCFKNPVGCSFCCHITMQCTPIEAQIAMKEAKRKGLHIDKERLAKQAKGDPLPFEEMKCVFLQADKTCGVYDKRPIACRSYLVKTPVDNCDTNKGVAKIASFANTSVELIRTAFLMVCNKYGSLPELLVG